MCKTIDTHKKELSKEEVYKLFGVKKEEIKLFETEEVKKQFNEFKHLINSGFITLNKLRKELGLKEIEGGDILYQKSLKCKEVSNLNKMNWIDYKMNVENCNDIEILDCMKWECDNLIKYYNDRKSDLEKELKGIEYEMNIEKAKVDVINTRLNNLNAKKVEVEK